MTFLESITNFYADNGEYFTMQEYEGRHLCKYTVTVYRRMLKAQIIPYFNSEYPDLNLYDFTPEILNNFFKHLMMTPSRRGGSLSPSYLAKYKALFTTFIKWMRNNDDNFNFNTEKIKLHIKQKERQHRGILTEEEQNKLIEHHWKRQDAYMAFILAINTGLRPGELRALTVSDVSDDYIKVRRAYNDVDKIKDTKTNKARLVPCDPEVIRMLRDYIEKLPQDAAFIFYNKKKHNEPVSKDYFILNLYRTMEALNIPRERYNPESEQEEVIVWYSLRHQTATRWVQSGLDVRLIARCMGHSTVMLQQRYANHFYENQVKDFGAKLAASGFLSVRKSAYCL